MKVASATASRVHRDRSTSISSTVYIYGVHLRRIAWTLRCIVVNMVSTSTSRRSSPNTGVNTAVSTDTGALSREAIVDHALALADQEGLGAVSIRRIAQDFGVTPMAL